MERIREELIKGKTLGTREVGFLGERGFTEEEIASLRRVIRTGSPEQPGALVQPRAITPDEFVELDGGRLQLLAQRLGLMQFMIDRLGQEPRGLGVELERHEGLIELIEKFFLGVARHSGTAAALAPSMVGVGRALGRDSNGEETRALNRAAERLEEAARSEAEASERAAERLERAADRMHEAAEAQSAASERANQNRLGHGSTPRREAIAMREG